MKTSSNYGLKLPEGTDNVKRQDFVDNFTKIDSTMKTIDNKHSAYGTTSGTNTYTVSITGITSLYDGLKVTVKIGTASTGASTLNINGLGAKTILDSLGNAITSGGLKAGLPYQLCYNGTNFIVLGKGGGGNATADKILSGYKATVDSGQIIGTMPSINNPTTNLNCGGSYTIPKGYHPGTEKVNANSLASQTQANAGTGDILSGKTAYVNGNKITGNMANNPAQTNANSIGVNNNNAYIRIPKGAYINDVGNGYSEIVTPYSMIANAVGVNANAILSNNSVLGVNGNIPIYTGGYRPSECGVYSDYLYQHLPVGYFQGAETQLPLSTLANILGITPDKIVSGNSICGVGGSAESRKFTTGTLSVKGSLNISINIGFRPNMVILFADTPISDGSLWLYGFMYNSTWQSIFSKDNMLSSWKGKISPNDSGFSVSEVTATTSSYAKTITYICA